MNPIQIKDYIANMGPATRINREEKAAWFLAHTDSLPELIKLCFDTNFSKHHKALWVLEIVLENNLNLLLPHLDFFVPRLSLLANDSAIRPASKICRWITKIYIVKKNPLWIKKLSTAHLEILVEVSFDWLIGPYKVAPKVYSMDSLLCLGYLPGNTFNLKNSSRLYLVVLLLPLFKERSKLHLQFWVRCNKQISIFVPLGQNEMSEIPLWPSLGDSSFQEICLFGSTRN